ncbi:MAG: hypothetical protein RBG13Loki_3002 [Promethearchaeota archaeon CR_4]|nr:MAG: hypothetical protein RBG13Loki_3002 [Candidatus Lokiarchaeota archaeon CR_4]
MCDLGSLCSFTLVNDTLGNLFDPNRKIWVLVEKWGKFGSGDILDEKGQKIGSIHRVNVSIDVRQLVSFIVAIEHIIHD